MVRNYNLQTSNHLENRDGAVKTAGLRTGAIVGCLSSRHFPENFFIIPGARQHLLFIAFFSGYD
jgi:hypothetical protein